MSNSPMSERVKGKAEELGGAIQKTVGKATGNQREEVSGAARQAKGVARQEVVKASERVRGAVEEGVGTLEQAAGAAVGDASLEREGKVDRVEGKVGRKFNK
jgi:uncharacterized protein YjbJ (UPF0337 family)